MIGIYKITNKINGKVYIGKSNNIHRRWKEEINGQVNDHLKKSFKRYGIDSFIFEIIKECDIENLNYFEKQAILEYKSYDKRYGYNKTFGGDGGTWSEEVCKKFSEKMMGSGNHFYGKTHTDNTKKMFKKRAGTNHWHYGGINSLETRKKQSITKLGANNPNAKIIYCFTKEGKLIRGFDCIADASRYTGIGYSAIKNCVSGLTKTAGGIIWSVNETKCIEYSNKTNRRVLCMETQEEFESITQAATWAGMKNPSGIHSVCNGLRQKAGNYHWKYL